MTEKTQTPKFLQILMLVLIYAGLGGCSTSRAAGVGLGEPTVLYPAELQWRQQPTGVKVATLYGDPSQPGPFVLRLRYPAGYRKEPHYHPRDAQITVLKGSYFRGYGDDFVESKAVKLLAGTFSVNPAGVNHYEWSTEPAELEVHAVGPWATIYVDGHPRP